MALHQWRLKREHLAFQ